MKQFLLLCFALSTFTLCAQNISRVGPGEAVTKISHKTEILVPDLVQSLIGTDDKILIIDTAFGPAYDLACSADAAIFTSNNGGFVSGSNGYSDIEKSQRIILDDDYTFVVTDVIAGFVLDSAAIANQSLTNQKLVANIYTDLPNEDTYGTFLGASDTLLIGDLTFDETGFALAAFTFTTPPSLTSSGSFLVGIDFSDVYNRSAPGEIGILTTDDGCGDGANAYEVFINDDGGISFEDIVTNWEGLNIEFFLGAVIDREPAVSTRTPLASYDASATPNPATEDLAITFNTPGNEQLTVSLLNAGGQVLRSQSVQANTGRVEWSVAGLPSGLYLYQLAGAAGIQTGKVVVR